MPVSPLQPAKIKLIVRSRQMVFFAAPGHRNAKPLFGTGSDSTGGALEVWLDIGFSLILGETVFGVVFSFVVGLNWGMGFSHAAGR